MTVRKRKPIEEAFLDDDDESLEKVEYPESDGEPMAETDKHRQLMVDLIEALKNHFAAEPDVYVSGNMLLYYIEGEPEQSIAPDVFVVRGIKKHERRIYKLWEEGRAPNVVIEVSSRKTKKKDKGLKKQLYAWLGVKEYFIFDPEYKRKLPFRAFRLHGQEYVEEAVTAGHVRSAELGLELVNTNKTLRLRNTQTGEFLRTPEEEATGRRQAEDRASQAEDRASQEAEARRRAEAELERLRAELAQLKKSAANGKHRKSQK